MTERLFARLLLLAIGALLGGVINAMIGRYATFKEAQGIAVALRSEIEALLEMVAIRNYLPEFDSQLTQLRADGYQPTPADVYGIKVTQDYFAVFHALSGKLGLLGEVSGQIVRLYTRQRRGRGASISHQVVHVLPQTSIGRPAISCTPVVRVNAGTLEKGTRVAADFAHGSTGRKECMEYQTIAVAHTHTAGQRRFCGDCSEADF